MIEIEKGQIGITLDNRIIVFESRQEFDNYDKEKLASFYASVPFLIDHLNSSQN